MKGLRFPKFFHCSNRWILALALAILALGVGLLRQGETGRVDPAKIRERVAAISKREGIVIGYGAPDTFFVPPYTVADGQFYGADSAVTAVEKIDSLPPSLDGIETALSAYPPGFFGKICRGIFLCGSLTFDGGSAGGSWKHDWIYIVVDENNSEKGRYDETLRVVHHEFSSLVLKRFHEVLERWNVLLPPDWVPARRDSEALKAVGGLFADPKRGFLKPYGATNAENDFNVYAETIFTNPSHVAAQADRYPVIARKLALLMEAYIQLDSRFEGVFERLGLLRFRSRLPAPFEEGVGIVRLPPISFPKGQLVPSESVVP